MMGKSVAEQNSVDLTWNLFMDESSVISATPCVPRTGDASVSASLSYNSVMATDIMDKDLKALREVAGKGLPGISHSLEPGL
jgi:hypothetical protein